jgi:D-glycero-alpha-D-manno-heptose 1-phosphate guanylyltransferase
MSIRTAVILAGGFGTRLRNVISDLPKPMAPVNGKPFLEYLLLYLHKYGIKHAVLSTGHLSEKIVSHFGNEFQGMKISYSHEESPLGTGGAVKLALSSCEDDEVLVMNGDSFFEVDAFRFYELHHESKADVSLALRSVDDASRYGKILIDSDNRIIDFKEKSDQSSPGRINGGIYLIRRKIFLDNTPETVSFSIEKDFFEKKCRQLMIKGFEFNGWFIDIGIPEDYNRAQNEFKKFAH